MSRPIALALAIALLTATACTAIPQSLRVPVEGATPADWNAESFWHSPWGASGTHKGIDIFGARGTPVVAAAGGWVVFSGLLERGGEAVAVLAPNGRLHYYAHLDSRAASAGGWVGQGEPLGTLGDTGNAAGKPPHLHYTILTPLPHPWRIRPGPQPLRRMFFLDPHLELTRD